MYAPLSVTHCDMLSWWRTIETGEGAAGDEEQEEEEQEEEQEQEEEEEEEEEEDSLHSWLWIINFYEQLQNFWTCS